MGGLCRVKLVGLTNIIVIFFYEKHKYLNTEQKFIIHNTTEIFKVKKKKAPTKRINQLI